MVFSANSRLKKKRDLTLKQTLSQRLRKSFKKSFDPDELKIFISPQGGDYEYVSVNQSYPLVERLSTDIVNSVHRSFLVLGDCGLGKTILALYLCQHYWNNLSQCKRLPIYIYLPSGEIKNESKKTSASGEEQKIDLLGVYLQKCGFSKRERLVIKDQPLLLILDGYDEIGIQKNLYHLNDWHESNYDIKVVTCCRPEALQGYNNAALFEAIDVPEALKYQTFYLQRFTETQIKGYLNEFVKHLSTDMRKRLEGSLWVKNGEIYWSWLERLPSIKKLATTPFLLRMITEVLPDKVNEYQNEKLVTQMLHSRNAIFDAFIEKWFIEQAGRLKNNNLLPELEIMEIVRYMKAYAQNLSACLINNGQLREQLLENKQTLNLELVEPIYDQELMKHYERIGNKIFQSAHALKALRSGCLLKTKRKQFKFLHKSLVEYFASRELFMGLQGEYDAYIQDVRQKDSRLVISRNILKDHEIIRLLAERVHEDNNFKELLCDIVMSSREISGIGNLAANAITILNEADVDFSGLDFSDIQIPGADINSSLFIDTNFSGANLENVKAYDCWFSGSKLKGTYLKGIEFGIKPSLQHSGGTNCIAFYSGLNGVKYWLTGNQDGNIHQWLVKSGEKVKSYNHNGNWWSRNLGLGVKTLAIDNKTQKMASSDGEKIIIWSLENGQVILELKFLFKVQCLIFDPQGEWLISGNDDCTVRLWKMPSAMTKLVLRGHTDSITTIAFHPQGTCLASGSQDNTIRLWQMPEGKLQTVLCDHLMGVSIVAFHPQGKCMVSGSWDGIIRFWNIPEGTAGPVLQGYTGEEMIRSSVVFHPQGEWLASVAGDTMCFWRMPDGILESTLQVEHYGSKNLFYHPEGEYLVCVGDRVHFYKMPERKKRLLLQGHESEVTAVAFHPKGEWLASGSRDNTIRLWQMPEGIAGPVLQGHTSGITTLAFHPQGKWLASGSWDETIRFWSIPDGRLISVTREICTNLSSFHLLISMFIDIRCYPNSIAFHPEGKWLASGNFFDETVYLWKTNNAPNRSLHGHTDYITSIVFHPQGKCLVSGSSDTTIRLWLLPEGSAGPVLWHESLINRVKKSLIGGQKNGISSLAFHPQGKWLASGSWDNTIRLWEMPGGITGPVLHGHTNDITTLAFHSQQEWLISGSTDKTIRFWQVPKGECIRIFSLWFHIDSIVLSPSSDYLITGGSEGNLNCFKIGKDINHIHLVWKHKPTPFGLSQADITQSIELSQPNQRLCQEHGALGQIAHPAQTYQAWCDLFKPISGTAGISHRSLVKTKDRLMVEENLWVLSVARRKEDSSWARKLHVFLILEGIKNHRRFILKADLTTPGKGSIVIKIMNFENIEQFKELAGTFEAQQWNVSKSNGVQLLKSIREDQQKVFTYSMAGTKSWFSKPKIEEECQSCVSWCKKQLRIVDIVIPDQWYNELVIFPSDVTTPRVTIDAKKW